MSFFYQQTRAQAAKAKSVKAGKPVGVPVDTLRKVGCSACPRNKATGLDSPKMSPHGDTKPIIYFLDSFPSTKDDRKGSFLADPDNDLIFSAFPSTTVQRDARYGAVVQCAGGAPKTEEVECCRQRVVSDIEAAQPAVVVGLGKIAMEWATGFSGGVNIRRGRLIPTKIGNHKCWFLALPEGAWINRMKGKYRPSEHELLLKHEVKLLMRQIRDGLPEPTVVEDGFDAGFEYITGQVPGDLARLSEALAYMAAQPEVAIDYETNDLRPYRNRNPKIYLVSVSDFKRTVIFPLDYPDTWLNTTQRQKAWDLYGEFLLDSGTKVAHNEHMELTWTSFFYGAESIRLTQWGDTMAQAKVIDERAGTLSLDDVVRMHFGFFVKSKSKVQDATRLLEYPLLEGMKYNGLDAKWCFAAYLAQKKIIQQTQEYQIEYDRHIRVCPTLVCTEAKGLPADKSRALELSNSMREESDLIYKKIMRTPEVQRYRSIHGQFDPASPDDVLVLMKDVLKRPEVRVEERDGVRYTTEDDALSKIPKEEVPSASLVLDLRQVDKLLSTYIDPILEGRTISYEGLIHSTYKHLHAVSGRLASEDPNVQNFPKRKRTEVRGIIYAPPGSIFAALDYGQIEARVIAMASLDRNLVDYLWTGYDIHGFWADRFLKRYPKWADWIASAFEIDRGDVAKIRKTGRQEAKNKWVFPQFFGSSFKSCARDLHIPEDVAEELAEDFWKEFAGVLKWQKKLAEKYERDLYVETLTGRRRRGAITKNELINHPVQGTAADIVLRSMCELSEQSFLEDDPHIHPNLNVHDDLSTIMPTEGFRARIDRIAAEMCRPRFDFINVPLIVEASTGQRWNELKEMHVYRSNEIHNHTR